VSYCDDILKGSKDLHLDECEVISVKKKITTVRITDSEIAEIKCNQEESIAVRIIHEKKIMSCKSSFSSKEENILKRLLDTRSFVQQKNFWKTLPFPSKTKQIEKTYDSRLANISGTRAIDIANEMINSTNHKKITRVSGSLNIVSEYFQVMNTNGIDYSDNSTLITGTINTDSVSDIPVSGIETSCSRTLGGFSAQDVGRDALEMCIDSINPKRVEQDTYDIIFEPYAFGELLAFVFSSNFNLKTYSEKRSCFTDKLENNISNESFSLIDDPHSPEGIGSKPFDDEGTATSPQFLIKSGILTGLFSDSFEAFKNGTISSGNAGRPRSPMGRSTLPTPIPMPHNLKVPNGKTSKDDIIQDTKKGLLVGRLWYAYPVNPEQGDFSCTARSGIRIIENGKIVNPGKSVRIVHNLKTLLENISAIGNDSRNILHWSSLPSITPTVRVNSIEVDPI
jgi:PmbA protein